MEAVTKEWLAEREGGYLGSRYYYFQDAVRYNDGIISKSTFNRKDGWKIHVLPGYTLGNSLANTSSHFGDDGAATLEELLIYLLEHIGESAKIFAFESMDQLMFYRLTTPGGLLHKKIRQLLDNPQDDDLIRELLGNSLV